MKTAPDILSGAVCFSVGLTRLTGTHLQTGDLFLEPELSLLHRLDLKRIGRRSGHFPLDHLIQFAVTVSQFADTSFDGHGLRLHG